MPLDKGPGAAPAGQDPNFSDRDLLVAILNGITALSARLGGGQLVIELRSAKTGRAVNVHASPDGAGFVASLPEHAIPVRAALNPDG